MVHSMNFRKVDTKEAPWHLLLEADPDRAAVNRYLPNSDCYVGEVNGEIVGVFVLWEKGESKLELMNIAVDPQQRGNGYGRALLRHAIAIARESGATSLEVGTGTFGYQLAYYQREGFRVRSIDHGFFLRNNPEPIFENGIQHFDMLRLSLKLVP